MGTRPGGGAVNASIRARTIARSSGSPPSGDAPTQPASFAGSAGWVTRMTWNAMPAGRRASSPSRARAIGSRCSGVSSSASRRGRLHASPRLPSASTWTAPGSTHRHGSSSVSDGESAFRVAMASWVQACMRPLLSVRSAARGWVPRSRTVDRSRQPRTPGASDRSIPGPAPRPTARRSPGRHRRAPGSARAHPPAPGPTRDLAIRATRGTTGSPARGGRPSVRRPARRPGSRASGPTPAGCPAAPRTGTAGCPVPNVPGPWSPARIHSASEGRSAALACCKAASMERECGPGVCAAHALAPRAPPRRRAISRVRPMTNGLPGR